MVDYTYINDKKSAILIFDLDGTLVDSREEIEYSFQLAFDNLGIKLDKEKLMRAIGLPLEDVIYHLTGRYDKEVEKEIRKIYYGLEKRLIRLFPRIVELIKNSQCKKAVLTSKRRKTALRDMEYLGILNLFDLVLGADDVNKNKPDGEGIKKIMKHFGIFENDRIYMIGDTEIDILTAKNAGVKSIAVTWGFRTREFLEKYKPDYIVDEPQEIGKIINSRPSVPVFSN